MLPLVTALVVSAPPPLQVAVVIDGSAQRYRHRRQRRRQLPDSVLAELLTLEQIIRRKRPDVELAVGHCALVEREPNLQVLSPFKRVEVGRAMLALLAGLGEAPPGCALRSEVLAEALTRLTWRSEGQRHLVLVVFTDFGSLSGRRTPQELAGDAEHLGIVLHVLEVTDAPGSVYGRGPVERLGQAVRRFVEHPTWAQGFSSQDLRMAALRSGGRHVVVRVPPYTAPSYVDDHPELDCAARNRALEERTEALQRRFDVRRGRLRVIRPRDEDKAELWRATAAAARMGCSARWPERAKKALEAQRLQRGLDDLYGPRDAAGRDVLDALAEGRLRPDEASGLPGFLAGVPLEPLLDAIFVFVDARAELESVARQDALFAVPGGYPASLAGLTLGRAILAGPYRMPSKR